MWLPDSMVIWFYGWSSYGFMGGVPSPLITSLLSLGTMALGKMRYYVLNFLRDLTRLRSQRVMWLHGWLPDTISHKLGGHKPCRKGDIKFSIWHVTSCDHVIREPCNFILGFALTHVSSLQHLVILHLLKKEIFCF